jgi:hypothetical protein
VAAEDSCFPALMSNTCFSIGINQLPVYAIGWQHGVLDKFCNFCFDKNPIIADNSTTSEAKEKICIDLESLDFSLCKK